MCIACYIKQKVNNKCSNTLKILLLLYLFHPCLFMSFIQHIFIEDLICIKLYVGDTVVLHGACTRGAYLHVCPPYPYKILRVRFHSQYFTNSLAIFLNIAVKHPCSEARMPKFKSWLCCQLVMYIQASYSTSLYFNVPNYEMGKRTVSKYLIGLL